MHEAYNLTAIHEQTAKTMWDPQQQTTLYTSKACYRNNFTFNSFDIVFNRNYIYRDLSHAIFRLWKPWYPLKCSNHPAMAAKICAFRYVSIAFRFSNRILTLT
jgi:hypothetical protein